jgi:Flp pilus assembly protein CpaB
LVAGFVVLGVFQYTLSVAVASAVVAGILVWRWWQRSAQVQPTKTRRKSSSRRKPESRL